MIRSVLTGSLAFHIRRLIEASGPLTVARYMNEALNNPDLGYYRTREPLGAAGDFVTAPEISQMFGELLGAWFIDTWKRLGSPNPVFLVELGPGRGTLLADLWRAAAVSVEFRAAVHFCLVETSPMLRDQQGKKLSTLDPSPKLSWYSTLEEVPDGAVLLVANEFFDALPVHQFVARASGWRERLVDYNLNDPGRFYFALSNQVTPAVKLLSNPGILGNGIEICPTGLAIVSEISRRLVKRGGAALIVDFHSNDSDFSLQGIRNHKYYDPLLNPGTADLSCAVDFLQLSKIALANGASVHGPRGQGDFLKSLGIGVRAERLVADGDFESAQVVCSGLRRLTEPNFMGELFQAMAITSKNMVSMAGFEAK